MSASSFASLSRSAWPPLWRSQKTAYVVEEDDRGVCALCSPQNVIRSNGLLRNTFSATSRRGRADASRVGRRAALSRTNPRGPPGPRRVENRRGARPLELGNEIGRSPRHVLHDAAEPPRVGLDVHGGRPADAAMPRDLRGRLQVEPALGQARDERSARNYVAVSTNWRGGRGRRRCGRWSRPQHSCYVLASLRYCRQRKGQK